MKEVIEFTVVFGVGVLAFARVGTPVLESQYAEITEHSRVYSSALLKLLNSRYSLYYVQVYNSTLLSCTRICIKKYIFVRSQVPVMLDQMPYVAVA